MHVCANSIEGAERVRGFAASAIVEVCDPYVCTREILEADGLGDRLVAGLAKVVTECRAAEAASALAAFGVVAEVLGDGFLPHYRSFADLVLALIRGNRPVRAGVCLYVCVSVLVCVCVFVCGHTASCGGR